MAGRPQKESIDYAGWDVTIFDNDPKIDKLMDAQGCTGFTIYFFLCQRAYGSYGYYYPWRYDDAATTAKKVGGGAGAESVEQTVRVCLQVGLFDKELFDRETILTSRGIQKRYMQVAMTRTNKSVIQEYWLLSKEESAGLNFRTVNPNFPPENGNFQAGNRGFSDSKVKESKGKERKGENGASAPTPEKHKRGQYGWVKLTDAEYDRLITEYGEEVTAHYITYIDESAQQTGNKNKWKDWNLTVRKAIRGQWGGGITKERRGGYGERGQHSGTGTPTGFVPSTGFKASKFTDNH